MASLGRLFKMRGQTTKGSSDKDNGAARHLTSLHIMHDSIFDFLLNISHLEKKTLIHLWLQIKNVPKSSEVVVR